MLSKHEKQKLFFCSYCNNFNWRSFSAVVVCRSRSKQQLQYLPWELDTIWSLIGLCSHATSRRHLTNGIIVKQIRGKLCEIPQRLLSVTIYPQPFYWSLLGMFHLNRCSSLFIALYGMSCHRGINNSKDIFCRMCMWMEISSFPVTNALKAKRKEERWKEKRMMR